MKNNLPGLVGPIYPQDTSALGPGGSSAAAISVAVSSTAIWASAGLGSLVYDSTVTTSPTLFQVGPFAWGVRTERGLGAAFRYDISNNYLVVVPLAGLFEFPDTGGNPAQGGICLDNQNNAWTIEVNSQSLVQIQENPPRITAVIPIKATSGAATAVKSHIAFDPAHNRIVMLGAPKIGPGTVCSYDLATGTITNDVAVGAAGFSITALLVGSNGTGPGTFVFVGSGGAANTRIDKLDSTSFATLATASFASGGLSHAPIGMIYAANGGTPKLAVAAGARVSYVDVGAMTVDNFSTPVPWEPAGLTLDAGGTLWVCNSLSGLGGSNLFEVATPFTAPTLSGPFAMSPTPGANTDSIIFDAHDNTLVSCSGATDEFIQSLGSVFQFTDPAAGALQARPPGPLGTVIVSGGPGASPTDQPLDYASLPGTGANAITPSGGTVAEVVPTETKLGFGTAFEVDSFAGKTTTTTAAFVAIATLTLPVAYTQAFDLSISVLGVDSSAVSEATVGIYRADLLFTAWFNTAGAVVELLPASPAPTNVRSFGTAITNAWAVQLVAGPGADQVTVQVAGAPGAAGSVAWSVIGQAQSIQ